MKRLLPLLVLGICLQAHAAITFVQQATAVNQEPGSSASIALTGVAANDLLVIVVGGSTNTITFTAADSQSQTVNTACSDLTTHGSYYVFYIQGALSGTHTETITASASNNFSTMMHEYSGVATTSAFDACAMNATGFGTAVTANSITPGTSGELAIAALGSDAFISPTALTWTSPLTGLNAGNYGFSAYDVSVTGAFVSNGTFTSGEDWSVTTALFKPAGGSSCTNAGWTQSGTWAVPAAGSTVMWLQTGVFGTVNCTGAPDYWQQTGVFGAN